MKLTHPDSKHAIEVDPKHADTYKSQGWAEVVEKKSEKASEPKKD